MNRMDRDDIFLCDIYVPEIVQEKADIAFSMIRTEGEDRMKNEKNIKTVKKGREKIAGILLTAACAAVAVTFVSVKGRWNHQHTEEVGDSAVMEAENRGNDLLAAIDNMFTLQVNAAELEKGKPVPLTEQSRVAQDGPFVTGQHADSWVLGGTEEGDIDYCIAMPLSCEGNNIEKITYSINNGAFQVVQLEGESIIIGCQMYEGELNTGSIGGGDYDLETGLPERNYETTLYKSLTLDYRKQADEYTWINFCNVCSDDSGEILDLIWGEDSSLEDVNNGMQKMLGNTVITCTAFYEDGTTQSSDIKVSTRIMTYAEAGEVPVKDDPNEETVYVTFELQ